MGELTDGLCSMFCDGHFSSRRKEEPGTRKDLKLGTCRICLKDHSSAKWQDGEGRSGSEEGGQGASKGTPLRGNSGEMAAGLVQSDHRMSQFVDHLDVRG